MRNQHFLVGQEKELFHAGKLKKKNTISFVILGWTDNNVKLMNTSSAPVLAAFHWPKWKSQDRVYLNKKHTLKLNLVSSSSYASGRDFLLLLF